MRAMLRTMVAAALMLGSWVAYTPAARAQCGGGCMMGMGGMSMGGMGGGYPSAAPYSLQYSLQARGWGSTAATNTGGMDMAGMAMGTTPAPVAPSAPAVAAATPAPAPATALAAA